MCGKLWTPTSKYSGGKTKFKTAGETGKNVYEKWAVPFLKVLSFLFADIFPAASDLLTVLHICFRFSGIILKKKKIKIRCFLFKMAYFLLGHLTEKYYCRNYMNGQNVIKFHPVGSTTFDMQVTRSEVGTRNSKCFWYHLKFILLINSPHVRDKSNNSCLTMS